MGQEDQPNSFLFNLLKRDKVISSKRSYIGLLDKFNEWVSQKGPTRSNLLKLNVSDPIVYVIQKTNTFILLFFITSTDQGYNHENSFNFNYVERNLFQYLCRRFDSVFSN